MGDFERELQELRRKRLEEGARQKSLEQAGHAEYVREIQERARREEETVEQILDRFIRPHEEEIEGLVRDLGNARWGRGNYEMEYSEGRVYTGKNDELAAGVTFKVGGTNVLKRKHSFFVTKGNPYVRVFEPRFLELSGMNIRESFRIQLWSGIDGEETFTYTDNQGGGSFAGYDLDLVREGLKSAFLNGPAREHPSSPPEHGG